MEAVSALWCEEVKELENDPSSYLQLSSPSGMTNTPWFLFLPQLHREVGLGPFQIVDSTILCKNPHVRGVKPVRLFLSF